MKDLSKLSKAIGDLASDDSEIRNQFKVFRTLTEKERPPLNSAGGRMLQHKQQTLSILKKLMDGYEVEMKSVFNIVFDVNNSADRLIRLYNKMRGARK